MGHTGHMLVILCGSSMAQVGHLWVNHGIFGSHRPFYIGQPSVTHSSNGSLNVNVNVLIKHKVTATIG